MAFPKSNMRIFLLAVEILPQREGLDLAKMHQKLNGLIGDYNTQNGAVTRVVYKFKVSGESKILSVIQVLNIIALERTIAGLSRIGGVKVDCFPLMNFESFSRSLQVSDHLTKLNAGCLSKDGLYWLQFDIEYHGKSTDDLITIWKKEAETILSARQKEGTSLELYKVVAQRKAHIFINAANPEQVDSLSMKLPLMQENGANVQITCKALQFLDDYCTRINSASDLV